MALYTQAQKSFALMRSIKEKNKKIKSLTEQNRILKEYARHKADCKATRIHHKCTCGFSELAKADKDSE